MATLATKVSKIAVVAATVFAISLAAGEAAAQEKILKIGVLGTMSGPAASWGLVNKYAAEATAQMYNEKGGVKIGNDSYKIQIVAIDDKLDTRFAVPGAERLTRKEGIKYIIGPNVDTTAVAIVPILESANAINVAYAFWKGLYSPRAINMVPSFQSGPLMSGYTEGNTILGMIASYQAAPLIYKYLMDKRGVKTVSFLTRNETDPLNQRNEGVKAARLVGLQVVSSDETYEPGTTDFTQAVSRAVKGNPDLIVLAGVAPGDAPFLIKAAREQGFKGQLSTETSQDAKPLREIAGDKANGFISVGGGSAPEVRSPYMEEFIRRYTRLAGEWNDEAGTKVYALEMILATLQKAGPKAIHDIEEFKKAIPGVAIDNPFLKEKTTLKYVGTSYFGRQRQIGVPIVVNEFRDGDFKTLFSASIPD